MSRGPYERPLGFCRANRQSTVGFWVVAMENGVNAKDWHKIDYKGKIAIVAGSEGRGIKKIVLDNCDFQTTIPMQGKTNSLNVSAAASVILFERVRQLSS